MLSVAIASTGTVTIPFRDSSTVIGVLMVNKSPFDCQIGQLGNQAPRWLAAGSSDLWDMRGQNNQFSIVITSNKFSSQVPTFANVILITTYRLGDQMPQGTYPALVSITEYTAVSLSQGAPGQASVGYSTTILTFPTQSVFLTGFDFYSPIEAAAGTVNIVFSGGLALPPLHISASSSGPVILEKTFISPQQGGLGSNVVCTISGTSAVISSVVVYWFLA